MTQHLVHDGRVRFNDLDARLVITALACSLDCGDALCYAIGHNCGTVLRVGTEVESRGAWDDVADASGLLDRLLEESAGPPMRSSAYFGSLLFLCIVVIDGADDSGFNVILNLENLDCPVETRLIIERSLNSDVADLALDALELLLSCFQIAGRLAKFGFGISKRSGELLLAKHGPFTFTSSCRLLSLETSDRNIAFLLHLGHLGVQISDLKSEFEILVQKFCLPLGKTDVGLAKFFETNFCLLCCSAVLSHKLFESILSVSPLFGRLDELGIGQDKLQSNLGQTFLQ